MRQLPIEPKLDLITAFDAIHDQAQPDTVLRSIRSALGDNGTFLMIEFKFSSNLEANLGNPFAALYYGISTMHCLTVSLAEGGAGLGTAWEPNSPARCSQTPGSTTSTSSTHPAHKTASSSASHSTPFAMLPCGSPAVPPRPAPGLPGPPATPSQGCWFSAFWSRCCFGQR